MKVNRFIAFIASASFFLLSYRLEGLNGLLFAIIFLGVAYLVATTSKDKEKQNEKD